MKKLVFIITLITLSLTAFSQSKLPQGSQVPRNQDMFTNFGFGVSSWGVPVYGSFEYMVHEEVSIGGEISYRGQSETYSGIKFTHRAFTFAARGNYHFNNLLQIKAPFLFYAGATLGYMIVTTNTVNGLGYEGSRGSGLFFGIQTGGNYYFTKNWAANVELGIGNVVGLKLGASYLF
jgi:outer membrane immunogenic protein